MSRLRDIVEDSDAIFLLTHTCESRWIPAVMARSLVKTLNTAALGLDGRIAMQRGVSGRASDRLGCYFCIP